MRTTADIDQLQTTKTRVWSIFEIAARADRAAIAMARLGLIVVLLWIGGLKAQQEHENAVAFTAPQAAADARRADDIADGAAAAAEPPRLYVKRGGRHYAPADRARLLPGEDVFIRQPDGHFECIGITDARAELPDLPIIV